MKGQEILEQLVGVLERLAGSTESVEEKIDSSGKSMMELFAQTEMLSKLADSGMEVVKSLTDCAEASSQFELSLAKLETIADTKAASMSTLSGELLELSNSSGVAAQSLAESAYQAISASVGTADAVDFVAQANELAVGGFTSTETAVDVLSTAINAYGLETDKAGQLADYLITTQNLGKTSVDQLAQSVGKVIPLAAAYNVEMDNLSSAYAVMTANGIATAETGTYLKAMLNELADSGSAVAGILMEETGKSFSELSASGMSLGDVMAVIGENVGNDATAFSNLWSSSEAGVGALSLLNSGTERYSSVLSEMQNSAGAASAAYEIMTDTAVHAEEKMTNAANNLKIAVGNSLLGAFKNLHLTGAKALEWLTEFVQEHETLVSGMSAGATAVAVLTAGVLGLSIAVTTVKAATDALNVSAGGTLKVVGLVISGLSVLAGVVTSVLSAFSDGEEEIADYDGTLEECRLETELTEAALMQAKRRYGENSNAVKELESTLETLNKQYEKGGGVLGEAAETAKKADEEMNALRDTVNSQNNELDAMTARGFQAVSMLETLSGKISKTDRDLSLMQSYADYLNDTFSCNIEVNYDTGELIGFNPDLLQGQIEKMYEDKKIQISMDAVSSPEFVDNYISAYEKIQDAQKRYHESVIRNQEKADVMYDRYLERSGTPAADEAYHEYEKVIYEMNSAKEAIDILKAEFDEYDEELRYHCDMIDESGELYESMSGSMRRGAESSVKFTQAVSDEESGIKAASEIYEDFQQQIEALCEAYDEVYESAYESFRGQFGLFDEASAESEEYLNSTVENAQKALDSQLAYWSSYTENIEYLKGVTAEELGITETQYNAIMSCVQDGSEQAAGLAGSIADALRSGNTEVVAQLAETYAEVDAQQSAAASATADWVTNMSGKIEDFVGQMNDAIVDLDLNDEAEMAARDTISSYADEILSGGASAVANARSVASQVAAALSGSSASLVISGATEVQANASGTTNSADVFIAGEQGPELIVGMPGSTVFPADETEKVISAVEEYSDFSDGYDLKSKVLHSGSSVMSFAPAFYLTLNGGTDEVNRKQVKQWMQQTIDEVFAGVLRVNPPMYTI